MFGVLINDGSDDALHGAELRVEAEEHEHEEEEAAPQVRAASGGPHLGRPGRQDPGLDVMIE